MLKSKNFNLTLKCNLRKLIFNGILHVRNVFDKILYNTSLSSIQNYNFLFNFRTQ